MKKLIDKKLFVILFLFYIVYSFLNTSKNVVLKFYKVENVDISWLKFFFESVILETFFSVSIILFIIVVTRILINKSYQWHFIFAIHVLFSLVSVLLMFLIYDVYLFYFSEQVINRTFNYYLLNTIYYSNTYFLIYSVNVFIIYTYYYVDKLKATELQKVELKQQLTDVQVSVLKYQLHPHFFFNTLNSISSLIDINPKLAQNTLADFSDLLRDILFLKDTNLMTLSTEMDILKRYIDIMLIRFSDHLKIIITIEDNLEDVLIPSLILQPIIENNIKHGYSYSITDLEIRLSIFKYGNMLVMEVENNGEPLKNNRCQFGTGLKNTEDRLKTLYDDDYVFTIKNIAHKIGVISKIAIPYRISNI